MSDKDREQQLLVALQALDDLKSRGLTVEAGAPCGVVIVYSGHVRGIWKFHRGLFRYTPAGYAVPRYQAATIEEAVAITKAVV